MIEYNDHLRTNRVAAVVFALLAGLSAISTAIAPAIIHI
jgi:hypothetical protein